MSKQPEMSVIPRLETALVLSNDNRPSHPLQQQTKPRKTIGMDFADSFGNQLSVPINRQNRSTGQPPLVNTLKMLIVNS